MGGDPWRVTFSSHALLSEGLERMHATCQSCDGSGVVSTPMNIDCAACDGTGRILGGTCPACFGTGAELVVTEVLCEWCHGSGEAVAVEARVNG